jgi:hypothetical protein
MSPAGMVRLPTLMPATDSDTIVPVATWGALFARSR